MPECVIKVRVTPRASHERVETKGGTIRVYVCSAPVDGEANEAVVKCLAKALGLSKSSITILKGHTSRDKLVQIAGLDAQSTLSRIS